MEPNDPTPEITSLVNRYAAACDDLDLDALTALWWHGATLEVHRDGPHRVSTATFRAPDDLHHVVERLATHHRTLHLVSGLEITPTDDPDVLAGRVSCRAHHVRLLDPEAGGGAAVDHVMTIRYVDRYRRANHRWRFEHRSVHLLWTEDHDVIATP